ncbi:hypothetical protein [Roseinatronobacter alkalisoli]|uniref:Uncharacterized protein n=1 Tax=Roseinatronobacter alkalisoli TaxID=3028235 RepID=A0ABT5T3V8_9RHOB|nr:hypothetical protein [Roseinatronobacter sp. HJB301]MDD7969809.1 hypothetical protein [Roseinatronobacter sp. HJB301]
MTAIRNILIIAQHGRLQYEALLFAASLRHFPQNKGLQLVVAEPQPGPLWADDPRISRPAIRRELRALGADIVPLQNRIWGQAYPHGNKIEALHLLPKGEPFMFFDTDTLITGPLAGLSSAHPMASMQVEPTWPRISLYGAGYSEIWGALYDRFGLDMAPTLDMRFAPDDWRRYMYFNAGWFTGPCPHEFGTLFQRYAQDIAADPPPQMATQALYPWLDQIALPLVVARLGGTRPPEGTGLDGPLSCHYRALPVLYASASDHAVDVLEQVTGAAHLWDIFNQYVSFRRMVFKHRGQELRARIDRNLLPRTYGKLQTMIREAGYWVR